MAALMAMLGVSGLPIMMMCHQVPTQFDFFDAFDGLHDYLQAAYCRQLPYKLKSNGIEGTYQQVREISSFITIYTNEWG